MQNRNKYFEYVIIWHPTEKQENEGEKAKIIVSLKGILAKDIARVQALAAREIPDEYVEQINQIEILIRQ